MVWRAPMKYEGMKEASFPEVVPSGCSIAKVTATDNSVAENFDVLTSALEQFRDIIKEEESLQNADLSCRNTKQTVGAIYTRTNFVTLKYVTDGWGTSSNGFRLVITAVKDPKHTCKDFRCTQNEFCIETDLLCDGVNHCGDESDEATSTLCANSEASTILGMQTTWFAIALVFLILSMGGLVTAAVLCFCRQRVPTPRHPHNAHNAQSHPPVSFPWIPSSSRLVQYVPLFYHEVSPVSIDQSLQQPVPARQSLGIIRRRTFARYHGQGGASDGSKMTTTNQAGCSPTWKICTILLLVCKFAAANTQTFVVSNTVDDQIGKDFFVGPCLVNTNQTCPDEEVTFFLFTKHNPEEGQQLLVNDTSSNLADTNFVAALPTKIIVHGYNSDMQLSYLVDVKNEYLKRASYNVIAIDWHRLAIGPCYPIAVHNVPHVGDCLAQLVDRLRDYGAKDIHVIGFSLGAHVPAFAANVLRPYKLTRITGLDPAMPLFITVNKDEKLDSSDAEFVDVLHTNAFIQGKIEPSGHIDFYMNGGVNQPGCWEHGNPFGCNHHRATEYFGESINSKVGFWGWPCPGFVAYLLGLCPPRFPAVLMGEDVNRKYRGFHLVKTKAHSPYAEGMFTVEDFYQQNLYQ
ncbi:PLA1A Phospholipase, partial [Acromyrmex heyeri]